MQHSQALVWTPKLGFRTPTLGRGPSNPGDGLPPFGVNPPKGGCPSPQLQGPHQSIGVVHPNSSGLAKAWECITPTRGASQKCGSPSPQIEGEGATGGEGSSCCRLKGGFLQQPKAQIELVKATPVLLHVRCHFGLYAKVLYQFLCRCMLHRQSGHPAFGSRRFFIHMGQPAATMGGNARCEGEF